MLTSIQLSLTFYCLEKHRVMQQTMTDSVNCAIVVIMPAIIKRQRGYHLGQSSGLGNYIVIVLVIIMFGRCVNSRKVRKSMQPMIAFFFNVYFSIFSWCCFTQKVRVNKNHTMIVRIVGTQRQVWIILQLLIDSSTSFQMNINAI